MTADAHRPGVKIVGNAVSNVYQRDVSKRRAGGFVQHTNENTEESERVSGTFCGRQRERTNERTGDTADAKAVSRLARRTQAPA